MKNEFKFADLHCHPTLKTYGHTFEDSAYSVKRRNIWYQQENSFFRKLISKYLGLTKFSQADFTTLKNGNVKIVTASLYPFEKGFFINSLGSGFVSAFFADIITGISYSRIRNIQQHINYFEDLEKEHSFLLESIHRDRETELFFPKKSEDFKLIKDANKTAIIFAIEGAHVFNSGLKKYGRETAENEVLENIYKVKNWEITPITITFAHNFSNDFCGHARSLDALGPLVNQNEMLNHGFTDLGLKVVMALLDDKNGKIIYPDLKHMCLQSRKEYYNFLDINFKNKNIPIIVSHGAVTGTSWDNPELFVDESIFCTTDINFYDEELVAIAKSNGLFAVQLDGRRLVKKSILKKLNSQKNKAFASAEIIWKHLEHIAILLDKNDLNSWNCTCIGSDFDGTINPLPGIYSASDLPQLANNLLQLAAHFLSYYNFKNEYNKMVTPETIVNQFCYDNLYFFYSDKF
ncbi:membrane dipeptidase [Flavobacterium sp. XS2P39]|uniref:membrane dipeptidase n=1 Tax=Flavobacterium sp. XS2P39 TaxID=3401725 RepID=UPI003AB089D9